MYRQSAEAATSQKQRVEALYQLGRHELGNDNLTGAEAAFREVVLLSPENSSALIGIGMSRALNDDLKGAEPFLRDAVELRDQAAFSPLGVTLDLQGRHVEAQAIYSQGLELRPGDRELVANLSLSYALGGDYDRAIGLADPLARLIVPGRYKRNYVLILALAGRLAEAQRTASSLEIDAKEVKQIFEVATKLRNGSAAGRLSVLRELTV
ncbi:Flp pilus assembly protein TadD [Candidatus Rhodobacter oscarellae]|uniref:Flp pilus assembly protein TadD n=1 Tax=Candidatus Rhodobacter oscarellae TaxID=1675527 RepID=A0A0J9E0Y2_9RHOB|nr:Flp pilus assembly protein TadD [Candidatus Rhodobacter lobularis]